MKAALSGVGQGGFHRFLGEITLFAQQFPQAAFT
jgi:hypothetical protein